MCDDVCSQSECKITDVTGLAIAEFMKSNTTVNSVVLVSLERYFL